MAADPPPERETDSERAARLARERQQPEESHEDVPAGHIAADGDVDAWLDRLRRDESLSEEPPEDSPPSRTA